VSFNTSDYLMTERAILPLNTLGHKELTP